MQVSEKMKKYNWILQVSGILKSVGARWSNVKRMKIWMLLILPLVPESTEFHSIMTVPLGTLNTVTPEFWNETTKICA